MKRYSIISMITLLVISGCTTNVNLDYDKHTNFAALKTYTLHLPPDIYTHDSLINSTLMQNRIISIIDFTMNERNYVKTSNNPDFTVKYSIGVKQEIESNHSNASVGIGSFGHHIGSSLAFSVPLDHDVQSYDRGIITIDIISSETGQLIWRGSSSRRMSNSNTPETLDRFAYDIVSEILLEFPPGYKASLETNRK
jgi:hypothetical protein